MIPIELEKEVINLELMMGMQYSSPVCSKGYLTPPPKDHVRAVGPGRGETVVESRVTGPDEKTKRT